MYETLLTNEESFHAEDMGDFFRVPCDRRDLNNDKYFKDGDVHRNPLTEFNSSNTLQLNADEVADKLLELRYIQNKLSSQWDCKMKILVTGSGGFIGKNLVCALNNIKDGKDRTRGICVDEVFEFDKNNSFNELKSFCRDADFIFHLAGANRPKTEDEFMKTNCGLTEELIKTLEECGNNCPVMMSSSTQALLQNPYADSKRAVESVLLEHENKFGAKAYIYRFPNVFGKWCRPNYNSAVATFCNNIANGLPIKVNDRNTLLTLVYIDDIIDEMIEAIKGNANKSGEFYKVPTEHKATLGEIVDLLYLFKDYKNT